MQIENYIQNHFRDIADSSGYTGDEEEDVKTTTSSEGEDLFLRREMKSSPFFHVAPRKRKRRAHDHPSGTHNAYQYDSKTYQLPFEFSSPPPIVPYKTSLYLLSRFLTHHMAQTNSSTSTVQWTSEEPPWRPNNKSTESSPSIFSEEHLQLDEALSFSLLPRYVVSHLDKFNFCFVPQFYTYLLCKSLFLKRILIEAVRPHRIVHANAAYARRHGKDKDFQFLGDNLEQAVMELFPALTTSEVVMYPVWGSDREADGSLQQVTHYLVEGQPVALLPMEHSLVVSPVQQVVG